MIICYPMIFIGKPFFYGVFPNGHVPLPTKLRAIRTSCNSLHSAILNSEYTRNIQLIQQISSKKP
jgi:hypothetical protein